MKTCVTLESTDRNLFGNKIKNKTKPDMLCLSQLQEVYNKLRIENGWKERELNKILNVNESPENAERLFYVLKERGLINLDIRGFMEACKNKTLIKVLKHYGVYKMYGKGENRAVYAQPDVFVLTALELNPMIYGKVVRWLTDNLVYIRMGVGDENNILMSRIRHLWNPDVESYKRIQRALNYIVFNDHHTGIRNEMSAQQLKDLENLQNNYAYCIDTGLIKDEDALLLVMHKEYVKRYLPKHKSLKNKNY
jgi:hypothetical protein